MLNVIRHMEQRGNDRPQWKHDVAYSMPMISIISMIENHQRATPLRYSAMGESAPYYRSYTSE